MLKSLYAKNFILIDELKVNFRQGLNIITGETGGGKSILINALGAILGDRVGKDIVRGGADKSVIEAIFVLPDDSPATDFIKNQNIDSFGDELIIRREINEAGRSRCFVNDTPVQVSTLAELGDFLVDLHGQHQHQVLLQPARHLDYVDGFADLKQDLKQFEQHFYGFQHILKSQEELQAKQQELFRSRDVLVFQLQEIEAINPQKDEDEELKKRETILRNVELLHEKSYQIFNNLYENNGSASELLTQAVADIDDLSLIDEKFIPLKNECESARIIIEEVAKSIQGYFQDISFDSKELEKIRERLGELAILKKKYGGTIDAVLHKKQELMEKVNLIENFEEQLQSLSRQLEEQRKILKDIGLTLSQKRTSAGVLLSSNIVAVLSQLGMPKAKFKFFHEYKLATREPYVEIDQQKILIRDRGLDYIEFFISANPGEEVKALAAVASGGEISRVMLALKTLLAKADKIPVLVFDEIDIGISGRVAHAVGKSLRRLANSHQIIAITHLPQIASMANTHYLVEKSDDGRTTHTSIRQLGEKERAEQIARLFGGENVSDVHLETASALIREAELFIQQEG